MPTYDDPKPVTEGVEKAIDWESHDADPLSEGVEACSVRLQHTRPARADLRAPPNDVKTTNHRRDAGLRSRIIRVRSSRNAVEQRYRSNLNTKILELKRAVPCLRSHPKPLCETARVPAELEEAPKLNKATVLNKAIEYIQELETRNRLLEGNIDAMQRYIDSMKHQSAVVADQESPLCATQATESGKDIGTTESTSSINGMIQVPPDFQWLRRHHSQSHSSGLKLHRSTASDAVVAEESQQLSGRLHVGSLVL